MAGAKCAMCEMRWSKLTGVKSAMCKVCQE